MSAPVPVTDEIRSNVVELIAKQRLLRLKEGGRFLKFSAKGQRVKDKFWFCKLSTNNRTLHYGDVDDNKEVQIDDLANTISINSITKLLVGKDCPHTKDGQLKKANVDSAFTIVYDSDHEEHLNFVAADHKTFCYWTDGLNALLKNEMLSEEFHNDLQVLSKIEHKILSLTKGT